MDVLDDLSGRSILPLNSFVYSNQGKLTILGEAMEVYNSNPWLVYSDKLHKFREFGAVVKEMSVLDESKLNSEQMRVICNLM
jgi:hypothetical protein